MRKLSRRELLKAVGGMTVGAAALSLLSACGGGAAPAAAPTAAPKAEEAKPTEAPKKEEAKAPEPTKAAEQGQPAATAYTIQLMQYRSEFAEDEEKLFNEKYAPLEVKLIEFDYTKLDAMFAAKTPPDMIRTYAPALPGFKARGLILDLTDRFERSKKINVQDLWEANDYYCFEPDGLKPVRGAPRYGMVKDFAPDNTIWCWKPAFDDAKVELWDYSKPPSYKDWMAAAKQITKKEGDRTVRFGFNPADYWVDRLVMSCLAELGKSLYSEDYTKALIMDDKDVKEALKWWYDAAFSGAMPTPVNPITNQSAGYVEGSLAMWQTGYWFTAWQRYNAKPEQNIDQNSYFVGAPWFFDESKRVSPTVTACGNVIASGSKNPDAVWVFYEHFMAEEPAELRAKNGWGLPAYKSWFDRLPKSTPHSQRAFTTIENEIKKMVTLNFNPYLGEDTVNQVWKAAIEKALRANTAADEVLADATKEINTLIQEGKDAIGA